jgi:hypothetical protein
MYSALEQSPTESSSDKGEKLSGVAIATNFLFKQSATVYRTRKLL